MAPPVFTISSARQKLFGLFHAVTSGHGRKVIITSRGAAGRAVLVGESYLKKLKSAAKRLRDIEAGHGGPADCFKLVGSGRVAAAMENPVGQIRLEAISATEKKLVSLPKGS